ncbi:MAG TPA: glyoxalase, partial [Gemmatimonadetes bacterium]|nr:glyoxalase [Gemmatimonadota bacterium]
DAHETLVERGVTFDVDPHFVHDMGDHELWLAFFKDSEENQLALMCGVAKS